MSAPYSVENSIRVHDEAIYNWLQGLHVDYGIINGQDKTNASILTVFASPDRAFATIYDMVTKNGFVAPSTNDSETRANIDSILKVLPLPVATIERLEPVPLRELNHAPAKDPRSYFDPTTGQWISWSAPTTYQCDYAVTFWSLKQSTDVFIRDWVYGQLGIIGSGNYETFIPVQHNPAIGISNQSLKLVSSTNLSYLEGLSQRYIRTRFVFSLRMLIFKNLPSDIAPGSEFLGNATGAFAGMNAAQPIFNVGVNVVVPKGDGVVTYSEDAIDALRLTGSYTGNLYRYNNNLYYPWNLYGNATAGYSQLYPSGVAVTPDARYSLRGTLSAESDAVEIITTPVLQEADGSALVLFYMYYTSDQPVLFNVNNVDPTSLVRTVALSTALPATGGAWQRMRVYAVVTSSLMSAGFYGSATQTVFAIAKGDVRQKAWYSVSPSYTPVITTAGSNTVYTFTVPAGTTYLATIKLSSAASADFAVAVNNSISGATYSKTNIVKSGTGVGAVFLVQPVATTFTITIPASVTVASVTAKGYSGPYYPSDLG
jgi:hypothetical protein